MEGAGDDKGHNRDVASKAELETSADDGEHALSRNVNSELGGNLLVQEGYLICNDKSCAPEMTLLEPEVGTVKDIVEYRISEGRDILTESRSGKDRDIEDRFSDKQGIDDKFSDKQGIDDKFSDKQDIDDKFSDKQGIDDKFSDKQDIQNEASEVWSNGIVSADSGTTVDQMRKRGVLSYEKVQLGSSANHVQPQNKALAHQPDTDCDTAHSNGISSKEPANTVSVPHTLSSNDDDDMKGLSPSDDGEIIAFKLDNTGESSIVICQNGDIDCSEGQGKMFEPVSDDELPAAIHVGTDSPCVQSLLKERQNVCVSGNDASHVVHNILQPGSTLVDSTDNPIMFDASKVASDCNGSLEVAIEANSKINYDLSSLVTQTRLGSSTLPLASSETKHVLDEVIAAPASPQSTDSRKPEEIHSSVNISSSLFQKKMVEPATAESLSDVPINRGQEVPTCCESGDPEYSNTFSDPRCSHDESDTGIHLPRQQSLPVDSSGVREKNNTVVDEDSNLNNVENGKIELSEPECFGKISRESSPGTETLNKVTETDRRQAASDFVQLEENLDFEDDGNDKPVEVAVVDVNGDDGKHEEGESSDRDEGELSDDDVEEGEIKEPGSKKSIVKSACPFFQKGSCTWGVSCRFLHPGVNDKGNYQMIEVPGFPSLASRARIDTAGLWPQVPDEQVARPAKVVEVPSTETAWERGLRLAKEQKKKATERKEQESGFENKQPDKESERVSQFIPRVPYYDQPAAYEEDMYYKSSRELLQATHYEDFQVRQNQHSSYAPPYRDSALGMPTAQYVNPYSPLDRFERNGLDQREQFRPGAPPLSRGYTPPPLKRPDEWTDPWRRSPQHLKDKKQSLSRSRRRHRSKSGHSHSSRSSSGSSSSSSRSSRSGNSSSNSTREQSRSSVSLRAPGGYDSGYYKSGSTGYQQGSYRGSSYGGGIAFAGRNVGNKSRDRLRRNNGRSTPDRPLPYARPRRNSGSSSTSSSSSRSRSRRRKSSRGGSRSSSSSAGSRNSRVPTPAKVNKTTSHPTVKGPQATLQPASQKHQNSLPYPPFSLDQIPHPSDPKPPTPEPPNPESVPPKPPQASLKAKDLQKPVGQTSSVKLTLLPKQPALDSRPNPLDSPPLKRQLSDDDVIVVSAMPAKKVNLPSSPLSGQRSNSERTRKIKPRPDKGKPPSSLPYLVPSSLSSVPGAKSPGAVLKQQPSNAKLRPVVPTVSRNSVKAPLANASTVITKRATPKKNMQTSRKELLKQLKAVEEAIAKKKSQLQ